MSNGDEQAFSFTEREYMGDGMYQYTHNPGLTKREYFAGLAMQGLLTCDCNQSDLEAQAVGRADELLRILEKGNE